MKSIKNILKLLFLFHFICVLVVNMSAFKGMDKAEISKLNAFGRKYVELSNKVLGKKNDLISLYTNLTGTNRGYEFFSPNISKYYVKTRFINDNNEEIPLYISFESKMKFATAFHYLDSSLEKKKFRNEFLESYAKRIFALNDHINQVKVVMTVFECKKVDNSFENVDTPKQIHLFTLKRQ